MKSYSRVRVRVGYGRLMHKSLKLMACLIAGLLAFTSEVNADASIYNINKNSANINKVDVNNVDDNKVNDNKAEPKTNIIFLIGDGMGVAYTTAYRYYQDQPATKIVDPSIFDEMFVGMASTNPDDEHANITDSAAAATALATGVKTYNGAIGVDILHQALPTLLDKAKELGYLTGIVVTSQVNHATPAAFIAHADSRLSYRKIADQYVDLRINGKPKVDVLMGGGQEYFIRSDRNLIKEFAAFGYSYQDDIQQLANIKKIPAIGLFSAVGMPPAMDSQHPLRLTEMTTKALELLQSKPFFLMLEASQIDWCGHANDIACAMAEMHDMAETMKVIKHFITAHPNTILVATADHSTGGLSLGANGAHQWSPTVVKNIKASAGAIAKKLFANKEHWVTHWQALTALQLTAEEIKNMQNLLTAANEEDKKLDTIAVLSLSYINKYSFTGWTSLEHTGEDVQIFSYGKDKNNFVGAMDNTDIAKKLFTYLQ